MAQSRIRNYLARTFVALGMFALAGKVNANEVIEIRGTEVSRYDPSLNPSMGKVNTFRGTRFSTFDLNEERLAARLKAVKDEGTPMQVSIPLEKKVYSVPEEHRLRAVDQKHYWDHQNGPSRSAEKVAPERGNISYTKPELENPVQSAIRRGYVTAALSEEQKIEFRDYVTNITNGQYNVSFIPGKDDKLNIRARKVGVTEDGKKYGAFDRNENLLDCIANNNYIPREKTASGIEALSKPEVADNSLWGRFNSASERAIEKVNDFGYALMDVPKTAYRLLTA